MDTVALEAPTSRRGNLTNQLQDLFSVIMGTKIASNWKPNGVKVYRALLTQASTDDPTAKVLENTLGGTVVLARSGAGTYTLTLEGAFTADKTFAIIGNLDGAVGSVAEMAKIERTSADVLTITTADVQGTSLADALMTDTPVEILVYPADE